MAELRDDTGNSCVQHDTVPTLFVTAYMAEKNYFLDENDLLSLRTLSRKNPQYKHASHIRFFSRFDVQ